MENTEKLSWVWPFKGGTCKERLIALKYLGLFALMAAVIGFLSLVLAPYF